MTDNTTQHGEIRHEIKQYLKSPSQQKYCLKTTSYENPGAPNHRIYQLTIYKDSEEYPLENYLFFQINHVREKLDQLIEKYMF